MNSFTTTWGTRCGKITTYPEGQPADTGSSAQYDPTPFLRQFHYATDHSCALTEVAAVMQQYNLLPNDAQILAACRQYGFAYLATYDPDFTVSCQQQGIRVIDSLATLNQLITI